MVVIVLVTLDVGKVVMVRVLHYIAWLAPLSQMLVRAIKYCLTWSRMGGCPLVRGASGLGQSIKEP